MSQHTTDYIGIAGAPRRARVGFIAMAGVAGVTGLVG